MHAQGRPLLDLPAGQVDGPERERPERPGAHAREEQEGRGRLVTESGQVAGRNRQARQVQRLLRCYEDVFAFRLGQAWGAQGLDPGGRDCFEVAREFQPRPLKEAPGQLAGLAQRAARQAFILLPPALIKQELRKGRLQVRHLA